MGNHRGEQCEQLNTKKDFIGMTIAAMLRKSKVFPHNQNVNP
jgi:hypothetical protein